MVPWRNFVIENGGIVDTIDPYLRKLHPELDNINK
jgi:hypothetical protein